MSYVTVFEITHEAIPLWFPFAFLFFSLWGTIIFSQTRNLGPVTKVARGVVFLVACLWVVGAASYFLHRRYDVQAYRNGKYKVVEGPVEHYEWQGKHECFTVHGVKFCHGTANQVGRDPPLRLGPSTWPVSLIREGLPVRIAYSDDKPPQSPQILRLEIGLNSRTTN